MNKIRIIARIDVKNEFVIKGIHLEGLRKLGDPNEIAKKYYNEGVDEIIFMDAVAAYYNRNSLTYLIKKACENIILNRFGSYEEVADSVLFLASSSSRYITAQTLNLNGGLYF